MFDVKRTLNRIWRPKNFVGSAKYWEIRYREGGNSGSGSYNKLAEYKADFINSWIRNNSIKFVQEFGCGDGNQAQMLHCDSYIGWDVSKSAIELCRKRFEGNELYKFQLLKHDSNIEKVELCLSLDVIYHLIEDNVYLQHLKLLFSNAAKYVIIYSCNFDAAPTANHVRPRNFSLDVDELFKDWKLIYTEKNPYPLLEWNNETTSWSDFFVYEKIKNI